MTSPHLRFLLVLLLSGLSAAAGTRHRVVVSTDIGGTDFDDFQSLVHLLVYADELDIEGLVSSPHGAGRKEHILEVLDHYATDYPKLRSWSEGYPEPAALRAMTKQGETEIAPHAGVRAASEGSEWIVNCARRDDPRPLHLLVWGGIEDLAQALHDAPDIEPRLRVHFIGGPNKKWSPDAYHYIASHHPRLWMIESNSSYRGWFVGGDPGGDLAGERFAAAHAAGRGALGEFFAKGISFESRTRSEIKMGDSPTVGWLLKGDPSLPGQGGWGGRFVRAWKRPYRCFDRLTTEADEIEFCAIMELALEHGGELPTEPSLRMRVGNQELPGHFAADGTVRFRFCPKSPATFSYTLVGNVPALAGQRGAITAVLPDPAAVLEPDPATPNWWTDDPAPALAEGPHQGARTVSQWRADFMRDFARRLERCAAAREP